MARSAARTKIHDAYQAAKTACQGNWRSPEAANAILDLALRSMRFLANQCRRVDLISMVPGKKYMAFNYQDVVSRPANRAFFVDDSEYVRTEWQNWLAGPIEAEALARMSYTVALAPCLAMELFDRNNKKGPATYFECLIGHIFARELRTNPRTRASLSIAGRNVRLTMDFLFEGASGVRLHLPVKMSTRERVVQAWAHQRVLDGAYGDGAYKSIMVIFAETKLDSRSHEVVEICVPDQWLAYQHFLAHIDRIYYFDVPTRYHELANAHPDLIKIKQFGEFFREKVSVLGL
jgi:hypothetical protein